MSIPEEQLIERCPHCGKKLFPDKRYAYTFHKWGTPAILALISLMLFGLDFTMDGKFDQWSLDWAHWASAGIVAFYIPAQLLRSNPNYGWLIFPIGGIFGITFFFFLDQLRGENEGFLGLDWVWPVIIPILTFVVVFPIVAHYARSELTHQDELEHLVDMLSHGE